MFSTTLRNLNRRARRLLVAVAFGMTLVIGFGAGANAQLATDVKPAPATENEIIKAGHRYVMYLNEGVTIDGDSQEPETRYLDNHRIGQEW